MDHPMGQLGLIAMMRNVHKEAGVKPTPTTQPSSTPTKFNQGAAMVSTNHTPSPFQRLQARLPTFANISPIVERTMKPSTAQPAGKEEEDEHLLATDVTNN